jgi:hypothetical protein
VAVVVVCGVSIDVAVAVVCGVSIDVAVVVVCGVSIAVVQQLRWVNSEQAESTERSENELARTAARPNSSAAITSDVLACVQP